MTEGAFDIAATVEMGPRRVDCTRDGAGAVGYALDSPSRTVRLLDGGAQLDLGAVGKGFAVDRMAACFQEWDLNQVIVNGGSSSILALDGPPGGEGWPVRMGSAASSIALRNQAAGVSGIDRGLHIVDPRTGRAVRGRAAAWCIASDATTADALSTAFMVLEPEAIQRVCDRMPGIKAMVEHCEATARGPGQPDRFSGRGSQTAGEVGRTSGEG
jgi:thiamine biosynthesis lipoprotein